MRFLPCLLFVSLFLLETEAIAQLDNSPLAPEAPSLDSVMPRSVSVQLEHLNFVRNNEYTNYIETGYTLFGYQLVPKVVYNVNNHLFLEAGAFLQKDYGKSGFKQAEPMFTARYRSGRKELIMGNLDGGFAHHLIEPLYAFENQLNRRLEFGNQAKYHGRFTKVDAWIDWQHMIYDYSPTQEEVWGGLSGLSRLFRTGGDTARSQVKKGFEMLLPFQFTGYHKGGQIDTVDKPLVTYFNAAIGVEMHWHGRQGAVIERLSLKPYYLGFLDYSFDKKLPFSSGRGIYINLSAKTPWFEFMASYWDGSDFTSWSGGRLYRSVGSFFKQPGYMERNRRLLMFRLLQDVRVYNNIYISARLEPFLDLQAKTWEFSHGLYLSYRGQLWKSKPF